MLWVSTEMVQLCVKEDARMEANNISKSKCPGVIFEYF